MWKSSRSNTPGRKSQKSLRKIWNWGESTRNSFTSWESVSGAAEPTFPAAAAQIIPTNKSSRAMLVAYQFI